MTERIIDLGPVEITIGEITVRLGLGLGLGGPGGAPAAPAITWNPADKGDQIVLSNGNLDANNNAATFAWRSVRATQSRTSGVKTYVITAGARSGGPAAMVSFANGSASMASSTGENLHSVAYTNGGNVRYNAVTIATLASWITGDVITAEIDIGASTVRFKKNAGAFSAALSVAGIGTTIFPAVSILDPFLLSADFTGW